MKRAIIAFAFVFSQVVTGQSELQNVQKTLQNYIQGSSYNELDILKSAFAENATLYLTTKSGFKRFTSDEYADFFKNNIKGEFNGRVGKVLSIDVIKDIAVAKVEIAGPERKWVYIDLFLLKKEDKSWIIISKTATRVDGNE
jgi:phosphoribosyl-AMP cyclohydrolase